MKKLMIAAVVAAMGVSAMADSCEEAFCAYAYRVKLAGKTVKGKAATDYSKGKVKVGEICDYESNCYAKPASLRIAGYIYGYTEEDPECDACICNEFGDYAYHFWDENKVEYKFDSVTLPVYDILRNSGATDKAQILFKFGDLNLAGFAAFNPKTQKIKSASGFFAGTLPAPKCAGAYNEKTCEWGEATTAKVLKPCHFDGNYVDAEAAIAFGRWSMTYKADKVATIEKTGSIDCLFPAAFKAIAE